jgi:hypothetical protein
MSAPGKNKHNLLTLHAMWAKNHKWTGLYNATKILAFAIYFCKMRVRILYWFYVWVNCAVLKTRKSRLDFKMKNTIGDGMKMFRKYQLAVWIKNLHKNVFAKNKLVELTYHKAGLLMQYPRKYKAKKVMKFQVLKVESANSTMFGSHFSPR